MDLEGTGIKGWGVHPIFLQICFQSGKENHHEERQPNEFRVEGRQNDLPSA